MRTRWRKCWPVLKAVLTVAILVTVGRRFQHDLQEHPELWRLPLRPGWLALSGVLYLVGLGMSAWYWRRLLVRCGQRPTLPATLRTYFLAHLGKYLPGKAWALVMRASLASEGGVRTSIAAVTSFYEVLVTMASGVLLAALLFALCGPSSSFDAPTLLSLLRLETPTHAVLDRWLLVVLALGMLAAVGIPILPPIFNRVVARLLPSYHDADTPPMHWPALLEGLTLTAVGWLFLGASLAAVLAGAVTPHWTPDYAAQLTASLALAYVAGFLILVVPSGLGVREFFLTLLLTPEIGRLGTPDDPRAQAILAVLLLRLIWTSAELLLAGVIYWLPAKYTLRGQI